MAKILPVSGGRYSAIVDDNVYVDLSQQAAKAYNAKAQELFGEYTYLNAIKEVVQPCLS